MNILRLRDKIINALDDLLGYYIVSGNHIPACIIDGNGRYLAQGKVKGLEVVIIPNVSVELLAMLHSNQWRVKHEISLKQWGDGDLIEPLSRIVPLLGNKVEINPRILPVEELGNIETQKITFTTVEVRRWEPI